VKNKLGKTLQASQKLKVMANFFVLKESVSIELPLSPEFQEDKETNYEKGS
jgi:hypothetical protein